MCSTGQCFHAIFRNGIFLAYRRNVPETERFNERIDYLVMGDRAMSCGSGWCRHSCVSLPLRDRRTAWDSDI
jgi:hypothetical protein